MLAERQRRYNRDQINEMKPVKRRRGILMMKIFYYGKLVDNSCLCFFKFRRVPAGVVPTVFFDITSISIVDFGWAKVHGSWASNNQIVNEVPVDFNIKVRADRSLFNKLDLTFQRHPQVEHYFLVDWTLHYTEEHIREVMKSWPNLLIEKMVQHHK
mmetsp:Transcript_28414/g.42002  ORF Transcript_28414/g.42002 Transcript_28414/m.42002 type:complete len:156 (-) Transcript_28414:228-695(-)